MTLKSRHNEAAISLRTNVLCDETVANAAVSNFTHTKTDCVNFVQTLKQVCIGKVKTFNVGHYSLVLLRGFLGLDLRCHCFTFTDLGRLCSVSCVLWFWCLFTTESNTTRH